MMIYLHPIPDESLGDAYASAFKNASEIFVLSAFLRDWQNFDISKRCINATIVVGKDFGITRKNALTQALAWKQEHGHICHFFVADQIDGFHPKIVMWREPKRCYLIIGSSNLTVAAFTNNYEANICIEINEECYQKVSNWIATILRQSRPVTQEWIDSYSEVTFPIHPNEIQPIPPPPPALNNLRLPIFPDLARAIAERRERIFAFDEDIRGRLEKIVRSCASGEVSQQKAYDWFIQNWNRSDWKFQGNGIFRRDQNDTNWTMLCAALVRCLDSPTADRDNIVQTVYDELEKSQRVAVRKAFLTEMLCHFFPDEYPLWNRPVEIWLKQVGATRDKPRGLSAGEKYIWLTRQLRLAIQNNPAYPAQNLAELDHVIWAYCVHQAWL